jgi:hypothetical protein
MKKLIMEVKEELQRKLKPGEVSWILTQPELYAPV